MADTPSREEVVRLARGLRAWVEGQRDSALDGFPQPVEPRSDRSLGRAAPMEKITLGNEGSGSKTLSDVREELGNCERCKLCEGRTQIVFGAGDPHARIMFVGEGPGEEEDRRGEPFVGRAGKLLTDIIQNGMGLLRTDVYIANVVKCRPPKNRNPEPDEIVACQPFLLWQIEAIRPEVVVALGKFAAQTLLQTRTPISKLRGEWHDYHGTKLMPTFHPSYLLRNPSDKRLVWEDIQLVMQALALPLPERKPIRDQTL